MCSESVHFSLSVNDGSYSTFSAHSSSIIRTILSAALIAAAPRPTPHTLKRCMYTWITVWEPRTQLSVHNNGSSNGWTTLFRTAAVWKKKKIQFTYTTKINITMNWKRVKLSAKPWIFRFLQYSHPLTPTIKLKPISDFRYIIYVTVNSKVNTIFFLNMSLSSLHFLNN